MERNTWQRHCGFSSSASSMTPARGLAAGAHWRWCAPAAGLPGSTCGSLAQPAPSQHSSPVRPAGRPPTCAFALHRVGEAGGHVVADGGAVHGPAGSQALSRLQAAAQLEGHGDGEVGAAGQVGGVGGAHAPVAAVLLQQLLAHGGAVEVCRGGGRQHTGCLREEQSSRQVARGAQRPWAPHPSRSARQPSRAAGSSSSPGQASGKP